MMILKPIGPQPEIAVLRQMTTDQLAAQLINGMTSRDMLIQLNGGPDTVADPPQTTYREDGQISQMIETINDVETGDLVLTRETDWTYYDDEPGAPVDTIEIIETDGDGNQIRDDVIKHYTDGRQPVLNPPPEILPEPIVINPPIKRLG
jgi:hypothetical protein